METLADLPVLLFASAREWEEWLDAHHAEPRGIWLKIAKKGAGVASVSHAEALDCALCYGWIDGQGRSYDEQFWLQKFTPRRPRSVWSQVNREKVAQLIEAGRMRPPGLREVEAAQQDGRWDAAYAPQSRTTVPEDFLAELDRHPQAKEFFQTLSKLNRYAICHRIEIARRPETRRARIDKFVAMLAAGETIYP